MGIWEIVGGCVLLLSSIFIIILVLLQESKGGGLSSVISGGEMMSGEGRTRSRDSQLAKYTKIAAIVFFVVTILVGVFSIYFK